MSNVPRSSIVNTLLKKIDNDSGLRSLFYKEDTQIRDPLVTLIQSTIPLVEDDKTALSLVADNDEYPYYRIAIDRSKDTKALSKGYFLPPLQPHVARFIEAQNKYIDGLTGQQKDAIRAYTYYGDRLINGFLRNSLNQENFMFLINAIRARGIVPFKTELLRIYPDLKRTLENLPIMDIDEIVPHALPKWVEFGPDTYIRRAFTFPPLSININNNAAFQKIVMSSWFNSYTNVLPLVQTMLKDLVMAFNGLLTAAPRDYDLVVYRGIRTNYLTPGSYRSTDFWSTSLTPYVALQFTANIRNVDFMIEEITIKPNIPCIYISNYSAISNNEWELLLPPGVSYTIAPEIYIKRNILPVDGEWALDDYINKGSSRWLDLKTYILVNEIVADGFDINVPVIKDIFGRVAERKKILNQRRLLKHGPGLGPEPRPSKWNATRNGRNRKNRQSRKAKNRERTAARNKKFDFGSE